mgnify:CR=1 FL=1
MRLHFRSDLVGVALVGATPLHLLSQTALPLKSPTGAFIAPLRFANAVPPQTLLRADEEELCQFDTIPPTIEKTERSRRGTLCFTYCYCLWSLIASFTSSAILNDLFAICNSRLLPTNQIVNCYGRVRPIQGRTLFLF